MYIIYNILYTCYNNKLKGTLVHIHAYVYTLYITYYSR